MELKPCDPKSMLKSAPPLQCPSFEGVNVGRGNGVPTVWVGDIYKEGNLVTTVGLTVWHINEYRHFELPPAHHGHFHSGMDLIDIIHGCSIFCSFQLSVIKPKPK